MNNICFLIFWTLSVPSLLVSSRSEKLALLVSFLEVTDAPVALVKSEPNYEKGKGVKSGFFGQKSSSMLKGQDGKIDSRVSQG